LTLGLPSLFTRDLWNPDEPRYAEVSREMLVLGEYFVPHLNGEIYAEKPPLGFWLAAMLQALGLGFSSGRIVTLIALLGILFTTSALARLWFRDRVGTMASVVLGSLLLFVLLSKMGVLDLPLAFLTTLSAYGWFRHRRDGGSWILLFFAGMGLATLTKGPVGILIPSLAALASWTTPRGPRAVRARHVLWGVALLVAIIAAWLVPACLQGGPDYARTILLQQNVGRMVTSWSHRQPWHYYLTSLPIFLFPWIVFAPWAFAWLWKQGKEFHGGALRHLILWFCLGLLIFSFISGKRARYLIPLLPPLAITVAVFLDHAFGAFRTGAPLAWMKRLFRLQHAVYAFLGLTILILPVFAPDLVASLRPGWPEGPAVVRDLLTRLGSGRLLAVGVLLLGVGALGWGLTMRDRLTRCFGATVAGVLTFSLAFDLVLTPAINVLKSGKRVGQQINLLAPPNGPGRMAFYPSAFSGVYNLYSGRIHVPVLSGPEEIDRFLGESSANAILMNRRSYESEAGAMTTPHGVIEAKSVGHRTILFLVNEDFEAEARSRLTGVGGDP
jgi:4-amino-4-deoxy-L-arabinose transferase-like glycosyltransferase